MQRFNKVVALLLCVVMLIGFVPVSALAADGAGTVVDAAIIFSDLHTNKSDYKESTLKGILNGIKNAGVTPSSVTSAGDAFSVNEDSTKYTGYTSTLTGYFQSVFAGVPVNYVWSDHDRYAVEADGSTLLDKTSRLVYGAGADGVYGTDDDGNYYIYSLSMGDLCSYDRYSAGFNYTQSSNNRASKGFTSTVAEAIENFKADAAKLNKDRPLFIASHQPLFDNRNDNAFAEDWFDAINEVAEGMDVAFFYGHNHKYDTGSDYYYAKGSKMNVATADNWNWNYEVGQGWRPSVDLTSEQKTLNFTHMCAGYMAPSSTGSTANTTRQGVAVAITIYDDAINYTTYNSKGAYTGNFALNETVAREFAKTEPEVPETTEPPVIIEPVADSNGTGITVAAPNVSAVGVKVNESPVYDAERYSAYASFDIELEGYTQGDTATVTIPVPVSFDPTRPVVVLDQGKVIATTDIVEGTVTFTTNHFSTYDIAQRALSNAVTAEGTLSSGIEVVGDAVNSVTSGTYYYLVNTKADETLTGTTSGKRLSLDGIDALTNVNRWYITSVSGNTYYVQYQGPNGKYLTLGNDTAELTDTPTALTLSYDTNPSAWDIGLGNYHLNDYRGEHNAASGYTVDAAGDDGSRWHFYPVTTASTYYELDTDGLDYGSDNKYLIVGNSNAVALKPNGTNTTTQSVTIENNIITNGSADLEWYFLKNTNQTGSTTYDTLITQNGNTWLYHTNGDMYINNNQNAHRGYWQLYGSNNGNYTFRDLDGNNDWYLYYNGSNFAVRNNNTSTYVRLFKKVVASSGETVTLSVAPGTATVNPGSSLELAHEVTLDGEVLTDGYEIIWSSENTDIVTVNGNGKVTAVGIGNATITATLTSVNDSAPSSTVRVSIQINVPEVAVERIEVAPMVGSVERGAGADTPTGSIMTVLYDNGETEEIPVTVGMITGDSLNLKANGTYGNLTVTYGGKTVEGYALNVVNVSGNNYPEYPNEGAVKVGKTGTGIDFQSSGIAQVEISASGVPMKRGVDIIVMLDMSSSMNRHSDCGATSCNGSNCSKVTRLTELKNALVTMQDLLKSSGNEDMMRIAIADFNGFFGYRGKGSGTPYDRDQADNMGGILETPNSDHRTGVVYNAITGNTCDIGADAFVDVSEMDITKVNATLDSLKATQGTNYDHGFDVIYQLGHAIKEENKQNGDTDRELVVIFMSDGAPNQYNYYHSIGGQSSITDTDDEDYKWNKWLQGTFDANQLTSGNIGCATHSYYYDDKDHDGDGIYNEHRMATAIKGDPNETYEVIRKSNEGLEDIIPTTNNNNLYDVPGLGATMYAVGFHIKNDGKITAKSVHHVLSQIPSSAEMYIEAEDENALTNAFHNITTDILYAAYNARYVDQMGENYDLQLAHHDYASMGSQTKDKHIEPVIEILDYPIYTLQDYENGNCAMSQIGDRKGAPTLLEVVKFSEDGKKAYSNLIDVDKDGKVGVTVNSNGTYTINDPEDNILGTDGVIYAKSFLYNTNATGVPVDGVKIPTGRDSANLTTGSTSMLPAETFYWMMGTVKTTELAMRYYVYLTGSMEGYREAGSYPTNEYADLFYDNYLGNPSYKKTVSPVLPWKEANVSYAFYLVNEDGEIIVNQTTGQTGSFANKIAVTNPVVHSTLTLNSGTDLSATVLANSVLPGYYRLYDEGAEYCITINSNSTGKWEITKGAEAATTHVTQFDPENPTAYSTELKVDTVGNDYTHTVVWFAVVYTIQAYPDTVVIDYGLPVDISVLANDMFGENGKLAGVGVCSDSLNLDGHDAAMASGFGNTYNGEYGSAKADSATGKVRYTPADMQMNGYEKFAYAVNYTGSANRGYYYDTVTVIPATTIYYEDSFVNFDNLLWYQPEGAQLWEGEWIVDENPEVSIWTPVGEADSDAVQAEDRPGRYSLTDANNIYGYDAAYANMSTYSLGSAMKATVDYDRAAQASFTFYGTGFDIISLTDSTTGMILLDVYEVNEDGSRGARVRGASVDTYYGYTTADCHVVYTWHSNSAGGDWVMSDVLHRATECTEDCHVDDAIPGEAVEGTEIHYIANAWIVDPTATGVVWQVPVMEVEGLTYGRYEAVIQAVYEPAFDHVDGSFSGTYDFYLDAIRIYDPANDGAADGAEDDTIEKAYGDDGEGWPSYIELRNKLIPAGSFADVSSQEGMVFIDGDPEISDEQLSDYVSYGPNNEVYLAANQSVAFLVDAPANLANIHIGISSANGNAATYSIYNVAQAADGVTGIQSGAKYNEKSYTVSTATDMYYDLSAWKNDIIVIRNTGEGIISLTNIKSTYASDPAQQPAGASTFSLRAAQPQLTGIYMTASAATLVLDELNREEIEELPEETVPETTVPEETEPEPTEPEETEPEVFEPKLFVVSVNKDSVKVGQKVGVTITTSSEVDYVTVNGKVISRPDRDKKGVRTWNLSVTAARAGIMELNVICFNTADEASEPVTRQITVRSKSGLEMIFDLIFDIFD